MRRGAGADFKSQLQELTQARWQLVPAYRVVKAAGPDHDKRFVVEVSIGDTVLGTGSGRSKKAAEAAAARSALQEIQDKPFV